MPAATPPIPSALPDSIILWSAGSRLKYDIQERYYGTHYCWCSPAFDSEALAATAVGANMAPSSNPITIYRELAAAIAKNDSHDLRIAGFRASIRGIAMKKAKEGIITLDQAKEIAVMAKTASLSQFKPLMYVIPYNLVSGRVQSVPLKNRANFEPEYTVPDLHKSEFHVIEL